MITRIGPQNINRSGQVPVLRRLISRLALLCCGLAHAQNLPFEPPHDSGQSITGAFEGWFANPDGSFSLLLGYYNRNLKQALDIRPDRTTGLIRAGRIEVSQLISCRAGNGASSR